MTLSKEQRKQLLQLAIAGDAEAFAQIFESLRPKSLAVAARIVGQDDAEDVVMEAYIKAWRALPRFHGKAAVSTWLYRIVYNCGLDFLRARKRSKEVHLKQDETDDRQMHDLKDERVQSPADEHLRGDNARLVNDALARLPDHHRIALELRYQAEMSYADIAAATGVAIGTVMSRLFNAKNRLRQIVREIEQGS